MNYRVSSQAKSDLIDIWEYTKGKWSLKKADEYYQNIITKFTELSIHPNLGKSYNHLREGYQGLPIKSHIIFYKTSENNSVEIIRILHQRMDVESRL